MVRQFHSSRSAYQVSPLVGIDDALSGRQKHSCGNQPMRPAKYFSVPHLRRVSIVDVVTDDDAPDWDFFLQGPGNTDKDLRVESAELLIRLAGDESSVAVPRGRDSVNDEPFPSRVLEPPILIKSAILPTPHHRHPKNNSHP